MTGYVIITQMQRKKDYLTSTTTDNDDNDYYYYYSNNTCIVYRTSILSHIITFHLFDDSHNTNTSKNPKIFDKSLPIKQT